jgi:hypothetical protein
MGSCTSSVSCLTSMTLSSGMSTFVFVESLHVVYPSRTSALLQCYSGFSLVVLHLFLPPTLSLLLLVYCSKPLCAASIVFLFLGPWTPGLRSSLIPRTIMGLVAGLWWPGTAVASLAAASQRS